jgi:hypothetical protein
MKKNYLFLTLAFSTIFAANGLTQGTIWGTTSSHTGDVYSIDPATVGYALPDAPGTDYTYQAIAHYWGTENDDSFFMTSYRTGSVPTATGFFNTQNFVPYVHLFKGGTNALSTVDLTTISGYSSTWFDRGPSGGAPWLNSGAGYYKGSVYLTAEYVFNLGASPAGFYAYPFLLKLDINSAGTGFTGVSKIDLSTAGLPTDTVGRPIIGDTGDLAFDPNGNFITGAVSYTANGTSTVSQRRVHVKGNIATAGSSVTVFEDAVNAAPLGVDGLAREAGGANRWFASSAYGNPSSQPRFHEYDPITGALTNTVTISGATTYLNDLTASAPVSAPEPCTLVLVVLGSAGIAARRRASAV